MIIKILKKFLKFLNFEFIHLPESHHQLECHKCLFGKKIHKNYLKFFLFSTICFEKYTATVNIVLKVKWRREFMYSWIGEKFYNTLIQTLTFASKLFVCLFSEGKGSKINNFILFPWNWIANKIGWLCTMLEGIKIIL